MDAQEGGMQELSNDASFMALLCDAGCSERPTVSTILYIESLFLKCISPLICEVKGEVSLPRSFCIICMVDVT